MVKIKYFAYGSNMSASVMRRRVGKWTYERNASAVGYKLVFSSYGFADIIKSSGSSAPGVLYELDESQMNKLDEKEDRHYMKLYRRGKIRVRVGGKIVGAIAYVKMKRTPFHTPNKHYLKLILGGLKSHGYGKGVTRRIMVAARGG